MNYAIIEAPHTYKVVEEVNRYLSQGWQLHGAPFRQIADTTNVLSSFVDHVTYQVMIFGMAGIGTDAAEYTVVQSGNKARVSVEIIDLLNEGWEFFGHPFGSDKSNHVYQAMIKPLNTNATTDPIERPLDL